VGLAVLLIVPLRLGPVGQLAVFTLSSWISILVARRAWPELWRVLLAYGFAARLPVVLIMLFSIFGGWDTHYSKPRPDFPQMGPGGLFFWTAVLPQLGLWIWLTVVAGILFGLLAVAALRAPRKPAAVVGLLAAALLAGPSHARDGKRIFVSVDMEGIGGAVTDQQLGTAGFEYQKFRELMTEEANAALAAAREAGATEFVVADSHGNFQNLLPDKFAADVQLVRGGPRPLSMMQGIDDSFDGVIYVGYHSSTTKLEGVRAHTLSSAHLADLKLNGVSVTEGAWNAALAGHFGVPILAVSGDEAAVKELQALVPGVLGAIVKWPYGFHAARVVSPETSRQLIRDAVKKAMARRTQLTPHRVKTPVEVEVRFKAYRPAEVLAWLPLFKRVDAHAVRFAAKDMLEATRMLAFVMNYQFDLQP
jgi:D-amino peptidase